MEEKEKECTRCKESVLVKTRSENSRGKVLDTKKQQKGRNSDKIIADYL